MRITVTVYRTFIWIAHPLLTVINTTAYYDTELIMTQFLVAVVTLIPLLLNLKSY